MQATRELVTISPGKLKNTSIPQPFPYQGSKRNLAAAILSFFPEDAGRVVEPFAGSAAISIAAHVTGKATSSVINDVNYPLMDLWRRIIEEPEALADDYSQLWREQRDDPKAYYGRIRAEFNRTREPHYLLYLLNRCVKAAVRYSKSGDFNQSADNRRLGARPAATLRRLVSTSLVMAGTEVSSGPYEDVFLGACADDVIYMDPPYQGVSNVRDHRYMSGLERGEFEKRLREANRLGLSYIVSYDAITTDEKYGAQLNPSLDLAHVHLIAGRSSQSTLLGGDLVTLESLYLSPTLVDRLGGPAALVELGSTVGSSYGEGTLF